MRSTIFTLWFFSFTFMIAAAGVVMSIGGGPSRLRGLLRFHAKSVMWMTRRLLGATIEVRGLEHLPKNGDPALLVSKHQSELDVFLPLSMWPDLAAIAMLELEHYPLIGRIIRKLEYILVSVEGKRQNQLRQVVQGARKVHEQDRMILIYPEGELMRVGSRERYRSGVWHIYDGLGVAATPLALSCGLVWPRREWWKNIGRTCVFEFLEPIPPGLDKDTFMREIEERIESRCMALIEEHGDPETVALARERHRLGLSNDDPDPEPSASGMGAHV